MTLMQGDPFAQLASGSLPALASDASQPGWSRSLNELKAAGEDLLSGASHSSARAPVTLLGNSADAGRLAASLKPPKVADTEEFTSVEQMLRQHRDGIMDRILQTEREDTRRKADALVAQQLQEDWEKERAWWLKETVGARTLGGSASVSRLLPLEGGAGSHLQLTSGVNPYGVVALNGPSLTRLDARIVHEHLEVVKSIGSSSSLVEAISRLQKIQASSSAQESCYKEAVQLMLYMLPNYNTPVDGALAALVHFSKQFQNLVTNRVRVASYAGQDVTTPHNYGSGMASTLAAFVKLEFGENAMNSIWHVLYFALRCSDAVAAKAVVDIMPTNADSTVAGPVQQAVTALCQKQSHASCLWEAGTPNLSTKDREALADLFERTSGLEPENIYKLGTIALLCGDKILPSSEARGFGTIEDYMFGWLWRAVQQENPLLEVSKLGEVIQSFGPAYFGNQESHGWSYTLPLLASQQLNTALTYLVEAGGPIGLLQATHLGLVMSLAGVPVLDVGEKASQESVVTSLLIAYSSKLETEPQCGAIAALEYLLLIPSKSQSLHEIAKLTARSYIVCNLGGEVSQEGRRRNSILDDRLNPEEVSVVLADTAEIFRKEASSRVKAQAAALFFMLAGRYSSVLMLLNELIAPPDEQSEDRRFWRDQSERFRSTYLVGRSLVTEALEKENSISLISTNVTLLSLAKFFELLKSGSIEEAWNQLAKLELLPVSRDDMSAKLSRYQTLDTVLKDAFPSVLKGAMECLHRLHRKAKSESHGMNSIAQSRLHGLQQAARLLVTFAGQATLSTETHESLARLEAGMV